MYLGEVHITNENLKDFIRVAEALQIRGLSKDTTTTDDSYTETTSEGEHQNKRFRILTEATLAAALHEDEEMDEEIEAVRRQHITKKEVQGSTVEPKVENLEFMEDIQHQNSASASATTSSKPQNITFMNMHSSNANQLNLSNQPTSNQQPRKENLLN
jgi:hypothetical protein